MLTGAPVYATSGEQADQGESSAWNHFVAPADGAEFYGAWLALLAAHVGQARAALLLLGGDSEASYSVAATWPDAQRDLQYLGPTAQQALSERRGVVAGSLPGRGAHVAYPVEVAGRLHGAVVIDIANGDAARLQAALRQIHWASGWLIDHFRERQQHAERAEAERVALLNAMLAAALQQRRLQPSALAVANEVAGRLRCDRVSIGFEDAGEVRPLVISHASTFDSRSDLVRHLGEAMDEAFDLGVPMVHPVTGSDALRALAHVEAARALNVQAMLSVPLVDNGLPIGVMVLERNEGPPFDNDEQRLARALGVVLAPAWALQRSNSRGSLQRLRDTFRSARVAIFGPRHPGLKLLGSLAMLLLVVVTLVRIDYRVAGRTAIEGAVQIASVAPFNGFIAEGMVRAGETVHLGQPIARLDDRDLKLERARWSSEREQLLRRYQVAMAAADRAAMGVIAAQIQQAEAQLSLAEERLARVVLTAPFDGVVVSGDLSQEIGAPVEQGKLLFVVAPLEDYRVVLQVDDRDIGYLSVGQHGELVLSSLPGRPMPLSVRAITPVATQQEGRNVFRVEAQLDATDLARLRPGMEGIGKVVVGQASLLWIWTHGFVDWLRLALWNWMP